jgi:hypothetical protein
MKKWSLLFFYIFLYVGLHAGDVLTLTNQKKFEGQVMKIDAYSVEFKADRNIYQIPIAYIEAIEFSDLNNPSLISFLKDSLQVENCLKGQKDGKKLFFKLPGFLILGMFGGPFPLIFIKFSNPSPKNEPIISDGSENKELFDDPAYLDCYQKQVKKQNMIAVGVGWAISTAFLVNLLFN